MPINRCLTVSSSSVGSRIDSNYYIQNISGLLLIIDMLSHLFAPPSSWLTWDFKPPLTPPLNTLLCMQTNQISRYIMHICTYPYIHTNSTKLYIPVYIISNALFRLLPLVAQSRVRSFYATTFAILSIWKFVFLLPSSGTFQDDEKFISIPSRFHWLHISYATVLTL